MKYHFIYFHKYILCSLYYLSDGSVLSSDSTGSLVDGGEIGIEVTWIRSSSWNFFSGSGDFSEGVGVGRHISQDDQNVQLSFVGQVLSSSLD